MMKRFKKYSFWVALCGAVVILIDYLSKAFGFNCDSSLIENIIMSVCGVLVVLGVVVKDDKTEIKKDKKENTINNQDLKINTESKFEKTSNLENLNVCKNLNNNKDLKTKIKNDNEEHLN